MTAYKIEPTSSQMLTQTIKLSDYASESAMHKLWQDDNAASNHSVARSISDDPQWAGLNPRDPNPQKAIAKILNNGDRETTELVTKATREVIELQIPQARSLKPAFNNRRAVGQRYEIERVLTGDALPWGRWERSKTGAGSKIVTLYTPLGASFATAAEELAWVPVAGIVIADLLEAAGYRVEIWATACADHRSGYTIQQRMCVKESGEPLDLNSISRATHPSIFRGVVLPISMVTFKAVEVGGKIGYGYGARRDLQPAAFGDHDAIAVLATHDVDSCRAEITRVISQFTAS